MEIPIQNLRNLPDQASYFSKNGRLSVDVKYIPSDTLKGKLEQIAITSIHDSSQVLCYNKKKELVHIRNETEQEEKEVKEGVSRLKWFKIGFICGVCVIIAIAILARRLKRIFLK